VLIVVGVTLATDSPDGDAPDEEWVTWVDDNAALLVVRAYLLVIGGLSLVALYALGVRPRLGESEESDRALAGLAAGSTVLAAGGLGIAGIVAAAVGAANSFGDVPIDASLARTLDNFQYGAMLIGGGVAAGVTMAVVAIQTLRRRTFPQWVAWLSILAVIGMATSLIFIPFILLPIWLVGMAVAVWLPAPARAM
jgi:hypothetical protein